VRTEQYPERPLEEETPLQETMDALAQCQADGLIRHIGVCNFGVQDLKAALATGVSIVSNQICYNLLWRGIENEVLPFCIQNNIGVLPWSPLGQGLLTGKYSSAEDVPAGRQRSRLFSNKRPQQRHGEEGQEEATFHAIAKMKWCAEKAGSTLTHASLVWLLEQNGVTSVLMGARNNTQLASNLECLDTEVDPIALDLLGDAGRAVLEGLGTNLDPYERDEFTRIK